MAKPTAKVGCAAHLPERPDKHSAQVAASVGRKAPNFSARYSKINPNSNTRIGIGKGWVRERRDFRVRIDGDEATAELIAFGDPDQPGVVFRAAIAKPQQFFQHYRDFHVRRGERIELDGMAPRPAALVVRRSRDRAINAREPAATFLGPFPDFRRRVSGLVVHSLNSMLEGALAPDTAATRPSILRLPVDVISGRAAFRKARPPETIGAKQIVAKPLRESSWGVAPTRAHWGVT